MPAATLVGLVGTARKRRQTSESKASAMIPFVPSIVPNVIQALVLVVAFALVLAPVLRKHPAPFYVLYAALSAVTLIDGVSWAPWAETLLDLFVSCYVGVAFYLVVMFAGALPRTWWVTKRLLSVRTELSVIGGFVIAAHICRVAFMIPLSTSMYWTFIWGDAAPVMMAAVTIVGVPLIACFLVPWITSFRFIRKRMKHSTWKLIQSMAYPFMGLLVLQGILLSLGHAIYVGPGAAEFADYMVNAATYVFFGIAYIALKVRMAVKHREKQAKRTTAQANGVS